MVVDRKIWRRSYSSFEGFVCPKCQSNVLVEQKDKEVKIEPNFSAVVHGEDWWEPESIEYRFATVLECPSKKCGEIVILSGSASVEHFFYETPDGYEQEYVEVYKPRHAYPAPAVFSIPEDTPPELEELVIHSFELFWIDNDSSLNAVRKCVERIMDDAKIPRTTVNNSGKRVGLALHSRIEKYKSKKPEIAETLMALKWLGNIGAHAQKKETETSAVLDAFEILEHALNELYSPAKKKISQKVKKINKNKGI